MTKKAIGAWASFQWDDTKEIMDTAYFSFGEGLEDTLDDNGDIIADHWGISDEYIFYFTTGEDELKSFMTRGVNGEFTVIDYKLSYIDED